MSYRLHVWVGGCRDFAFKKGARPYVEVKINDYRVRTRILKLKESTSKPTWNQYVRVPIRPPIHSDVMISVKDDNSLTRKKNCGIAVLNRKEIMRGMPFGFKHITLFATKGFTTAVGALDIRVQLQYPKTTVLAPNRATREMLGKFRLNAPFPLLMVQIKSAKGGNFGYKKTQVAVTVGEFEVETDWWNKKGNPRWRDSKFWCDCGVKKMEVKLKQRSAIGFIKTRGVINVNLEKYTGGNQKDVWLTCLSPSGAPAGELLLSIQMMFYHSVLIPPDFDKRHLKFHGEIGRTVSMARANNDHNMLFLTQSQTDLMSAIADSKQIEKNRNLQKLAMQRNANNAGGPNPANMPAAAAEAVFASAAPAPADAGAVPVANASYVAPLAMQPPRRASAGGPALSAPANAAIHVREHRGHSSENIIIPDLAKDPEKFNPRSMSEHASSSNLLADIEAINKACAEAEARANGGGATAVLPPSHAPPPLQQHSAPPPSAPPQWGAAANAAPQQRVQSANLAAGSAVAVAAVAVPMGAPSAPAFPNVYDPDELQGEGAFASPYPALDPMGQPAAGAMMQPGPGAMMQPGPISMDQPAADSMDQPAVSPMAAAILGPRAPLQSPMDQPPAGAMAAAVPISATMNMPAPASSISPAEAEALNNFASMGMDPSHNAKLLELFRDCKGDINATAQRALANGLF